VLGRVVVVGLGPGGTDLLTPRARAAFERADRRFARTARHPAVTELRDDGLEIETFDDVYDSAPDIETVYRRIADHLIEAAATSVTAYAVPGSPVVGERSVVLLRDAASRGEIHLEVVPGLSFVDLALARLGVDPLESGVRVVDAHDLVAATAFIGAMLVAQCDHPLVLADLQLALLEHLPPETPVTVLARLGLPDERVEQVALAELDRVVPDHLTTLCVEGAATGSVQDLARLLELATRLRAPGGCPWDAEQTHRSLTRYLLEEAYEVVEAVDALPASPDSPEGSRSTETAAALADELGDLLYQVIFHAVIAAETGAFDLGDVARGIHDKLVRRHPHVFGDVAADSSAEVMRNWEQIKKDEKGSSSIVSGITPGLPALLYAHKLYRKAASVGLDPGDAGEALARIRAAADHLASEPTATVEQPLGDLLAAAVAYARAHDIDAESALAGWSHRFRQRFEGLELLAAEHDVDLASAEPATVVDLWVEAGRRIPEPG